MMAPVLVFHRFNACGPDSAVPATALVIIVFLVIFVALRYLALRGERA